MPWSKTPVVTLILALAHEGLLPSVASRTSAFFPIPGNYPMTTTIHFSGLNIEPVFLFRPASYSRYRVCTWISLLTWWLTFDQVGLPCLHKGTHWVTITNFINIYLIPRSRIYLGTRMVLLGYFGGRAVQLLPCQLHLVIIPCGLTVNLVLHIRLIL